MRALVIDDEDNLRRTTSALLEGMGHEVVGAGSGTAALEQLDKLQFDVAFLDLKLKGESGLDVLPNLLKNSPSLEVVVFTAFATFESAVEAMRRGAADYVPKPFTPDQIRQIRVWDN
jgi:NtrC-family two-component system response regulator AlgB